MYYRMPYIGERFTLGHSLYKEEPLEVNWSPRRDRKLAAYRQAHQNDPVYCAYLS